MIWELWVPSTNFAGTITVGTGEGETKKEALEHWYGQHPRYWGRLDFIRETLDGEPILCQPERNRSDIQLAVFGGGHTPDTDPFGPVYQKEII